MTRIGVLVAAAAALAAPAEGYSARANRAHGSVGGDVLSPNAEADPRFAGGTTALRGYVDAMSGVGVKATKVRVAIFPRNTACSWWKPGMLPCDDTYKPPIVKGATWTALMETDCAEWQKKCDLPTATVEKSRAALAVEAWIQEFKLGWAKMADDQGEETTLKVFVWPEWRFRAGVGKPPLELAELKIITDGISAFLSQDEYKKNVVVMPGSIYYGAVPKPKPNVDAEAPEAKLKTADVQHSTCAAWQHHEQTKWDDTEFAKHAMFNCVPRFHDGTLVGSHCKANEYENRAKTTETWGRCLVENHVALNADVSKLPGSDKFAPVKSTMGERDYSVDVCMDHAYGWKASSAFKLPMGTKLDFLTLIANGMGVNCCNGQGCDNLPLKNSGFVVRCDGKGNPTAGNLFKIDTAKVCASGACSWAQKAQEQPLKIYSADDTFKYQGKTWTEITTDGSFNGDIANGVFDFMVTNAKAWVMVSNALDLPG